MRCYIQQVCDIITYDCAYNSNINTVHPDELIDTEQVDSQSAREIDSIHSESSSECITIICSYICTCMYIYFIFIHYFL